jgi:hypothetical protein
MCYQFEFDRHLECMEETFAGPGPAAMCTKRRAMHDRRQTCAECREVAGGLTTNQIESFDHSHIAETPSLVN